MRSFFLMCVLLFSCIFSKSSAQEIDPESLRGTWYVQLTNFPKWLMEQNSDPRFVYEPYQKKGSYRLDDHVVYCKNGKSKSIRGTDRLRDSSGTRYRWRGRGLLWFFKSDWQIMYMSPDRQWMIIRFSKSLFTPAGVDVISRNTEVSPETRRLMAKKLDELELNSELSVPNR